MVGINLSPVSGSAHLDIGSSCFWNHMLSGTSQPSTLDCLNCRYVKHAPRITATPLIPEFINQPGKKALDLIIDFLSCLWEYAKEQITREIGAVADLSKCHPIPCFDYRADACINFLDSADVWLTVPAAWDAKGCNMMRDAAISAGLVQSSHAGDRDWRDRLRIITYVYSRSFCLLRLLTDSEGSPKPRQSTVRT